MKIISWIRRKIILFKGSIAFYPAIIACGFLLLAWLLIYIDFSATGKQIKQTLPWISLKDANTARTIISTIVGGILSLTVFSFSMVMIVLNQAASQMSNRMLSSMIENRFQQIVLGFYIGSIVYALFLLSTIRDIHSGIYVPALSIYLLILLTVVDIFLFIYFLDYVTQSVKYGTIINRVKIKTFHSLEKNFDLEKGSVNTGIGDNAQFIMSPVNGHFQGYDIKRLMHLAQKEKAIIHFTHPVGTFLLKGSALFANSGEYINDEKKIKELLDTIDFFDGQPINLQPEYGFRHLTEVAIRALSPGINDPATAVLCLNALTELFAFCFFRNPVTSFADEENTPRIFLTVIEPEELWKRCMDSIWQYGKNDLLIQRAFKQTFIQLLSLPLPHRYQQFLVGQQKMLHG